jgi:hypothetical protein
LASLAAFILAEREQKDSFWKPYLDALPKSFRMMPVFLMGQFANMFALEFSKKPTHYSLGVV